MDINKTLAEEFKLRQEQIDNTVALLDDDKTIPFIARYRKELTGSLDDQVLREIADRLTYLRNLEKRKGEIISSITEQEKMTDDIMSAIENAKTLVEVEDIYRPFKPKRKTRASVAREKAILSRPLVFAFKFELGDFACNCISADAESCRSIDSPSVRILKRRPDYDTFKSIR